MAILVQFLLRLSFGLAVGMAVTSSRQVSSGFYRNHLYVTLGLTTLAALVAVSGIATMSVAWLAAAAAVLSYVGAVCWLYEAKKAGTAAIWFVAGFSLAAAWLGIVAGQEAAPASSGQIVTTWPLGWFQACALLTSGLVLGSTFAAMLLGHWYLNSPGMELAPLRRLLVLIGAAVGIQMIVSGTGLAGQLGVGDVSIGWLLFVALRWSFGLLGVSILVWMAWQTLKIPNTQSATGILYVAVMGVFVGELTSLLLSAESAYPL